MKSSRNSVMISQCNMQRGYIVRYIIHELENYMCRAVSAHSVFHCINVMFLELCEAKLELSWRELDTSVKYKCTYFIVVWTQASLPLEYLDVFYDVLPNNTNEKCKTNIEMLQQWILFYYLYKDRHLSWCLINWVMAKDAWIIGPFWRKC